MSILPTIVAGRQTAPEPRAEQGGPCRRRHLAALLTYLLLSLSTTYPLVFHLGDQPLGILQGDQAQTMWNQWWVSVALLDRHSSPFHTDLLFYPAGADLYWHTLNLPATLLGLGLDRAFGLIVAYNGSVLLALVLSAYAGFRLLVYLLDDNPAALLGGALIGFNPLTQVVLRGQLNLISIQWPVLCIEFYLRAWDSRRRRDALLAGLFFTLALLTVAYFEVYLVTFFAVHLGGQVWARRGAGWRAAGVALARRARPLLVWGGGPVLLLAGPYVLAAALSLRRGQILVDAVGASDGPLIHSADLLSFVVPPRDHVLLGWAAPWWGWVNPAISDAAYVGPLLAGLAVAGLWAGCARTGRALWLTVAVVSGLLAMGPNLRFDGQQSFGGVPVPLPFALARLIPPYSFVHDPDRFSTLMYVALGVLAAAGVHGLLARVAPRLRRPVVAVLGGLLVLSMVRGLQPTSAVAVPASMQALARDPAPGALLEFPFTNHGPPDAPRMLYQTAHGRAITGGYLSRKVADPNDETCAPLLVFRQYPDITAHDIVTPSAVSQMPAILAASGVRFLAVYKVARDPQDFRLATPVPTGQLSDLQSLAASLGTSLADDAEATTYRLRPAAQPLGPFLQLGGAWYDLERRGAGVFRWLRGTRADLCVFSPRRRKAALVLQVAGFGADRPLQIRVGPQPVLQVVVPADGQLHRIQTAALDWPAGPQPVSLATPGGAVSPLSLGQGRDDRALSLGFGDIQVLPAAP